MNLPPDASRVSTSLAVTSTSDTQTFTYPTGTGPADFGAAGDHKITGTPFTELSSLLGHITVTFGATGITVVNNTERTFQAGQTVYLDLDLAGFDNSRDTLDPDNDTFNVFPVQVYLGAPDTADVDGLLTAYTGSAPALNGALVSGGVGTFDVPRNIVVDSGGADTAVLTFTGTDVFGETIVESITLNGTTAVGGKKAFKTVTAISSSGAIANGAFAGPGDVLGLPVFLESAAHVIGEIEDGAVPTAGTAVGGVSTAATATTGDVRGTYDPNSACDGSKVFELLVLCKSKSYKGVAQYAG